jgi:phenylpropionate dioxygenase-like ring-hydroxylating dioxygenase large terminal subunit
MLKNFWYAVEFSQAVKDRPHPVQLSDRKIALYRGSNGTIQALGDICPHRGASLSIGRVENGCLACPYHGWQFAGNGECIKIPSNLPGATIPKRASAATYPVREKDGWIWIFWGEAALAEGQAIPDVPAVHDPSLRSVQSDLHWAVNYERAIDNVLDFAHAPFVHAGAFGNPEAPEVEALEIISDAWGASAVVTMQANPPKGLWKLLTRKDPAPVKTRTGFVLPNLTYLEVSLAFGRLVIWTAHVPIDEQTTVSKVMSFRSFFTGKWADADALKRTQKILAQDRPIVESQLPKSISTDTEIHVAADGLQLKYREYREKFSVN